MKYEIEKVSSDWYYFYVTGYSCSFASGKAGEKEK